MNYHVNDILLRADLARIVARFHTKYERRGPDECWPWIGSQHRGMTGYGSFRVYGFGDRAGRAVGANRLAWALAKGPIEPRELYVLHRCDNPACVNPAHLFLGTHADNQEDKRAKGRQSRGADNHGKLTDSQVASIRADLREHSEIAAEYGIHKVTVSQIQLGKRWTHVGGARAERNNFGERHRKAILTEEQVRRIRRSRADALLLAGIYGVARRTIYCIRARETWRHI